MDAWDKNVPNNEKIGVDIFLEYDIILSSWTNIHNKTK